MLPNIVITSLEEDLKRLGLANPATTSTSGLQEQAPVLESQAGQDAESSEASEVESEPAEGETLSERVRLLRLRRPNAKMRMQRRKRRMMRKRMRAKLRLKAKRFRKSTKGRRFARKYRQALKRFHGHAPKGRRISLRNGLDQVANMIEDVQNIVKGLEETAQKDAVQGFAQVALIGHELAEQFGAACQANLEVVDEDGEQLDFCALAEHFEELSESAAEVASGLNEAMTEGVDLGITDEDVTEDFNEMLGAVLEGLEIFDALTSESDLEAGEEDSPRPTK